MNAQSDLIVKRNKHVAKVRDNEPIRLARLKSEKHKCAARINALKGSIVGQPLATIAARTANQGTIWITNGLEFRKIKRDLNLPVGFRKGRR